ncbi:MAG: helix-turn-helix transcriptional regulator [Deltaproteobacteria bacterium]|nr:helix-turn-helix transcriptional regulator [Deltaproteobacteria bacterium]
MSASRGQELINAFAAMIVEFQQPEQIWPLMLSTLQECIGFDAGYIAASWGSATEGRGAVAAHDEPFLKRNLGRYLAEILPEEIAQYADRARIHHDVWSRERQKELSVFREVLDPTGMQHMIVRVSISHGNVAGFNLERRYDEPFTTSDLGLVDTVAPFLHIVEVLTLRSQDEGRLDDFCEKHRLTKRERELVSFAARGLQNSEIGILLSISPNTVRNTLAKVFEKVGVTNRAELTYLTAQPSSEGNRAGITPPRSHLPPDGLQTFAARVKAATASSDARQWSSSASPRTKIVYTPPLSALTT